MKNKSHLIPFLIVNLFLAISTAIVTVITLTQGTVAGQVDTSVTNSLFYIATFTVLSNILLGIVAVFASVAAIVALKRHVKLPNFVPPLYLVATSATMLTFLTVVLFLAPLRAASGRNYFEMLMGPMFFFHFFNPVLAAGTFIFLTGDSLLTLRHATLAIIPPALYAIPYILNVVVLKTWIDFYNFTFGGNNLLVLPVFLVICAIIFGIASLLIFLRNRRIKTCSRRIKSCSK